MTRVRLIATAITVALVAAACTGDTSATTSPAPVSAPVPTERVPPSLAPSQPTLADHDLSSLSVTVGSKRFIEQEILGHILIEALASAGAEVTDATNLGGSVAIRRALVDGAIDLYPEYNGTCWIVHLGLDDPPKDGSELTEACRQADLENGIAHLGRAPFNDTYALAAGPGFAAEAGSFNLLDVAAVIVSNPETRVCMGREFRVRDDGLALFESAAGVEVPEEQIVLLDQASIYRETAANRCDFGVVFSTDGRLDELGLTLADDPGVFINYNPSVSVRAEMAEQFPELTAIAEQVLSPLNTQTIVELNRRVAVEGELPEQVARDYLSSLGLIAESGSEPTPAPTPADAGPLGAQLITIQLQEDLTALGFYAGDIDGVYGPGTESAVRALQASVDTLDVDGVFGPATAGTIGAILGRDDTQSVRAMQEALTELGYYQGNLDGDYGPATAAAVADLQRDVGLDPTGQYDAATANALVELYELRAPDPESITEPEVPEMAGSDEAQRSGDAGTAPATEFTSDVLKRGSTGPEVEALQARLAELGYRPGTVGGTYGDETAAAVMAFQKREGLDRDGQAGPAVFAALAAQTGVGPRNASGPRIEVDIVRQIAFVVLADGSVTTINVSTGNGKTYRDGNGNEAVAFTPAGDFVIERRIDGIRMAALGSLYRPLYFKQGWAVHGSANVPAYPASHGCVRTHNWDQDWLVERVADGIPVVVYDDLRGPEDQPPEEAEPGF